MSRGLMLACLLLAACSTEESDQCNDPTGLYRATVTWKTPTCSTPATTVTFLITAAKPDDLYWTVEFSPWNAKGDLYTVSSPNGCNLLDFQAGTQQTSGLFEGYILAVGGDVATGSMGGHGFRTVDGTSPCKGEFSLDYIVKEAD